MSGPGIRDFEDFREYSLWYAHDVGLGIPELLDAEYKIVQGPVRGEEIPFGDYAGRPKWRGPADFPSGQWNGRDIHEILANLANIQGDTEFGSNEQQVGLWNTAPSDYDRKILLSVMQEEFRHGWQMGWFETEVLKSEQARWAAQSLLERRSGTGPDARLLGAFNNPIRDWIGMYCFLEFMDRDGGSQLSLLQDSAVMQLSRSMTFMLREEAKHLRSGQQGFERILEGARLPVPVLQRYVNLFAPLGYDLHGGERSTNALIYYKLGLKGYYPQQRGLDYTGEPARDYIDPQLYGDLRHREAHPAEYSYKFLDLGLDGPLSGMNKELLNSVTVTFYKRTLERHFEQFNAIVARRYPAGTPPLVLPSLRWNRAEPSVYAGERYDIRGNPIASEREYEAYRRANLPGPADEVAIRETAAIPGWIAPPETDVYRELTHTKEGDDISFRTVFGTRRRSRYTRSLSAAAREAASSPASAGSPGAGTEGTTVDLWSFMDRESGGT